MLITLQLSCQSVKNTPAASDSSTGLDDSSPVTYAQYINETQIREMLYTYASDEFEGRETGTAGEARAVAYLVDRYRELGIPGGLEDGSYRQAVPLAFNEAPDGTVVIGEDTYENGNGILTFSSAQADSLDIVYAGYGIDDPAYSDFDGLDVEGKVILARFGEPENSDGTYLISGSRNNSAWGNRRNALRKRLEVANARGARGLLFYDPNNYNSSSSYLRMMQRSGRKRMVLQEEKDSPFSILLDMKAARALMPDIEEGPKTGLLEKRISIDLKVGSEEIEAHNVVAFIKGRSKPDEYIVISAHLDHIGVQNGKVNNGADDDGSGTIGLLEIAEAFKKAQDAGHGPDRSIVFLHVTGEEKGLFGSRYYTDMSPVFPLEQTVANLNIDMIGRTDPKRDGDRNYIYLIGSDKLSSELHEVSEQANRKYCDIQLDYQYNRKDDPNRFYYRSDHYNFAKNDIPVIFYFNGTHADYHRPSDTPDKIEYDLLENRARLVFFTAWELANREQAVRVDPDKRTLRP